MLKKDVRLTIGLEVLSILFIVLGMLLLASCGSVATTTIVDTSTTSIQTLDVDTTYVPTVIPIIIVGDSSTNKGDYIHVQVRDSVVIKDSVVIRYKYITKTDVKINHPPIYTFTKYGHAKAWMYDNILNISMIVNDKVIQETIDSAIMVINIKELNKVTTVNTTDTVKSKTSVWKSIKQVLILLTILLVVGLIGYIMLRFGVKLRK